ncbi:hypothetical protein KY284_018645 [Solanum tuberosum]|nr:hypothetical protein KY284_018645 [Solanum tuberosum]
MSDNVICVCCGQGVSKSIEHLFIHCNFSSRLWAIIAAATGIDGPFIQLKDTLLKWWKAEMTPKLKYIYKTVLLFILWQIWKRRNIIKHGGKMTQSTMTLEIGRNLHLMARCIYPWLKDIPTSWPMLVKFMEDYTLILVYKVVKWIKPTIGFKCYSDGAFKGNSGPSFGAFCIRDVEGNF